jgi:threonine dehydratase
LLAVSVPEAPGSFLAFCNLLGRRSITEFNYRYFDAAMAQIFVGISSSGLSQTVRRSSGNYSNRGFKSPI